MRVGRRHRQSQVDTPTDAVHRISSTRPLVGVSRQRDAGIDRLPLEASGVSGNTVVSSGIARRVVPEPLRAA
jgi:hypothetical protein